MLPSKIDFLVKYDELLKIALDYSSDFPDKLCNFIVKEFELAAAALFKINSLNDSLELLGKSPATKKSLSYTIPITCPNCKNISENNISYRFNLQSNCNFNITDYFLIEGCIVVPIIDGQSVLLKLAKKGGFSQSEINGIESISESLKNLLKFWIGGKNISSNSLNSIVSNFSQELRNSTNSIMGFASLLNDENLPYSQKENVSTLKQNAFELLSVTNDLIEISKVETNGTSINLTSIDFNSYITEIMNYFYTQIDKSRIEFVLDIDAALPKEIKVDLIKLKYIIINLLINSVRLTEKGKISLSISAKGKQKLLFRISDTSPGLNVKRTIEFFQPFALTDLYTSKFGNLTGLSLTLSKKYIELLNGEINITTGIGKGIIYTFTVAAELLPTVEEQLSILPKPIGVSNKILVVEDDYASSKLLGNYLTKWGYEPTIVSSAFQAMTSVETQKYIAIIVDVVLPDASGFEVLQQIRQNIKTKHLPVIICSVSAEQQKAFMMGAVEYFIKPINFNFLMEVLANYKLKREATILIVDDDIPTLNLIKESVEKVGFKTIAEHQSNKVINMIENVALDLAIIDLDMPIVSGFELIKMIKSNKKFSKLPIVIYTGKESYKEDLKKIDGLFSELFLKNSKNIEDLADTVNSIINKLDETLPAPLPILTDIKKETDSVKILLVEDYKHSQIIVTRLLRKNSFESIVVVENGLQAYEEVQRQHFDLILMDMQMAVMNGFEATQKIRKLNNYKKTPIIALTAFAMKGDREKCIDAGATDYLPKPLDSQEFIEKVKFYTNDKRNGH